MKTHENTRVVIVGGGFGGLETALYLRQRLGDKATVTIVADRDHFLFRPYLTYVPFGLVLDEVQFDLHEVTEAKGVAFLQGRAQGLDLDRNVLLVDEQPVPFDFLIVATGAATGPATIPGLQEHGHTVWHRDDMFRLRTAFQHLLRDVKAGQHRRIVFFAPPSSTWVGPMYELMFMLATWLQWKDARDGIEIALVTAESTYLQVLGANLHPVIEQELAQRRIAGFTGQAVRRVEADALIDQDGERRPYDLLITTPPYVATTPWDALPADEQGFLQTELPTRQVVNHPDIYAVGDASDYPVKQAFLALLQADAAAEHLAARVLKTEPAFQFEPSSIWMMEQLDQAVFARMPLPEEDDPDPEYGDRPSEVERLPVGILRRMMVSTHLPREYGANPLYAGLFWKGTKVGLKILSHLVQA